MVLLNDFDFQRPDLLSHVNATYDLLDDAARTDGTPFVDRGLFFRAGAADGAKRLNGFNVLQAVTIAQDGGTFYRGLDGLFLNRTTDPVLSAPHTFLAVASVDTIAPASFHFIGDVGPNYCVLKSYIDPRDGVLRWCVPTGFVDTSGTFVDYVMLATDAPVESGAKVYGLDYTSDPRGTVLWIDGTPWPFVAWEGYGYVLETSWHLIANAGWPPGWYADAAALAAAGTAFDGTPWGCLDVAYGDNSYNYRYFGYALDWESYFVDTPAGDGFDGLLAQLQTWVGMTPAELVEQSTTLLGRWTPSPHRAHVEVVATNTAQLDITTHNTVELELAVVSPGVTVEATSTSSIDIQCRGLAVGLTVEDLP